MKSFKLLLVSLIGLASLPALAGPAGAIFCKDQDQRVFSAYDITLQAPNNRLYIFEGESFGGTPAFEMETYKVKGELLAYSEDAVSVRYVRPDGQNAQGFIREHGGRRAAPVIKVTYTNKGMTSTFRRAGTVTIELKGEPTKKIEYTDCTYEGGTVAQWDRLWDAH